MEVHHHSHTAPKGAGRKKWTHYFWEFFMLFLAVFCGFLAEYQLEHKIEKDRSKELARSLYEELKGDSINASVRYVNRVRQEQGYFYLMNYFRDSSLTNLSKTFQLNFLYGVLFRSPALFEPRTVIFDQLKNSGSLRYFKNKELQQLIGDLSVSIRNVIDRQALETSIRINLINPFIIRHYDYQFETILRNNNKSDIFTATKEYEKSATIIPFRLHGITQFDREYAVNLMGFTGMNGMESTRTIHLSKYIDVNKQLLALLRELYHLK